VISEFRREVSEKSIPLCYDATIIGYFLTRFLGSLLLDPSLLTGLRIYMFFKTTAMRNELRQE
jgi:hypothetical protein